MAVIVFSAGYGRWIVQLYKGAVAEIAGVKIDKATGATEEKKGRAKRSIRKTSTSKKSTDANDME